MNAAQIMRMGERLASCRPEEKLSTALARMNAAKVGSLPVIDELGRLVGVLDRTAAQQARKRSGHNVGAAMKRKVFCCRASDTLSDVETSLREQDLDSIPVIDDAGWLRGTVSMSDLPWAVPRNTVPAHIDFSDSATSG